VKTLTAVTLASLLAACTPGQQKAAFNNTLLANTVKAKLVGIDADALTEVRVTVSNGAVTLTGEAHDQVEKDRYVAAARSVSSVTSVADDLRVNPDLRGLREQSADMALAARVSAAIAAQTGINVVNLKVSSRAGVVSVEGHVPSASIARTVVETARAVPGVTDVVSRISIQR